MNRKHMGATEVAEALERARVVGVLDGWLGVISTRSIEMYVEDNGITLILRDENEDRRDYQENTPDAARAAAALAIEKGEV